MRRTKTLEQRFWPKIKVDDDSHLSDPLSTAVGNCWIWTGASTNNGYGTLTHDGKQLLSHRVSLMIHNIPLGEATDHLCRRTKCVNPSHLETVTHRENARRGLGSPAFALRFDMCKYGHPLKGKNLTSDKKGDKVYRKCRICTNRSAAIYRAKIRDSQLNIQELNALGRDTK